MEDNLNFKESGRQPQLVAKWKTPLICLHIEVDNNLFYILRRPQCLLNESLAQLSPSFFPFFTYCLKSIQSLKLFCLSPYAQEF